MEPTKALMSSKDTGRDPPKNNSSLRAIDGGIVNKTGARDGAQKKGDTAPEGLGGKRRVQN